MPKKITKPICQILLPLPFDYGFSYFVPDNLLLEIGDVVKVPFRKKELFGVVVGLENQNLKLQNITQNSLDESKIKTIISKENQIKFSPQLLDFINFAANYNLAPKGLVLKLSLATLNNTKELKRKPKNNINQATNTTQTNAKPIKINLKPLLTNQQQAAKFLLDKVDEKKFSTILLDGITGSGKTEIYFQAIAKILNKADGQVLILLPEIALTSQLCKRFFDQFGFMPDLWHSKIGNSKKRILFFKIADGSCRVLIGARSALFLPFKNMQLIVADEEHDASFKQEDIVNYHGRDMAVMRAKIENFLIILSSATPSLETYLNAKINKYHLIKLEQRFGQQQKTTIKLLDMRQEKLDKNQFIASDLKNLLKKNLENNQQSLLFLNRRGYAPLTLCGKCGTKITCNDCSSYVTYHQKINRLICHHCGTSKKLINACGHCGGTECLISCGAGVEKLQEEVLTAFPEARIGLMTSDNIKNSDDAENVINEILEQKIDIIIGTQMIAKGHHFPALSLVGIIDGDGSFASGSLRTAERSFQLLTQVIGRAGRENYQGNVIVQTYNPENQVFQKIIEGKRDEFLDEEIKNRQALNFPPFSKMAKIIFSGLNEIAVIDAAKSVLNQFPFNQAIEVFGPAPMPILRIKNRYYYCLNIKVDKKINLQKLLNKILESIPKNHQIRMKIDIDPL